MAKRSLSSLKRVRQNERRRLHNKAQKSALKSEIRRFTATLGAGDAAAAEKEFRKASKALDQVAARGVIHKNTAARRKSRLARRLNALRSARGK